MLLGKFSSSPWGFEEVMRWTEPLHSGIDSPQNRKWQQKHPMDFIDDASGNTPNVGWVAQWVGIYTVYYADWARTSGEFRAQGYVMWD